MPTGTVVDFVDVTPGAGALELRGSHLHGGDFAKIPPLVDHLETIAPNCPRTSENLAICPLPYKLAVCRPAENDIVIRRPGDSCSNVDFQKRLRGTLGAL
jgi:hypothetical protein